MRVWLQLCLYKIQKGKGKNSNKIKRIHRCKKVKKYFQRERIFKIHIRIKSLKRKLMKNKIMIKYIQNVWTNKVEEIRKWGSITSEKKFVFSNLEKSIIFAKYSQYISNILRKINVIKCFNWWGLFLLCIWWDFFGKKILNFLSFGKTRSKTVVNVKMVP